MPGGDPANEAIAYIYTTTKQIYSPLYVCFNKFFFIATRLYHLYIYICIYTNEQIIIDSRMIFEMLYLTDKQIKSEFSSTTGLIF